MDYPMVTVVIPMRNEELYIALCLESLLMNNFPTEKLEILVMDGRSTDKSREIVQRYCREHPHVRLLDNPRLIQAAAMNIGIREARGEIIVRADAHTVYDSEYIRQCATLLMETGACSVGGVQRGVGNDYVTRAIAIATQSRFAAGDARYRYCDKPSWVDTVYLGAWWVSSLKAIGGFDETWVINEDYELNFRLRQAGGRILLSPTIRSQYYVRGSLPGLARQYYRYGVWKVKTLRAHPDSLRWRQLVAPAFLICFFLSVLLIVAGQSVGCIVPTLYATASLVAAVSCGRRGGWKEAPLLPVVFALIHLGWGAGFIAGLLRFGIPQLRLQKALETSQCQDWVERK